jgi:DNA-binding CsgD family transcriptional regulator
MFKYAYTTLKERYSLFSNTKNWFIFVFISNIFIVMLYSLSWGAQSQNSNLVKFFDVLYSCTTFIGLGYAMVLTFRRQRYKRILLSKISIFVVCLMVIPQLFFLPFFQIKYFDFISILLFFSHIALIYLFIVLTLDSINEQVVQSYENLYTEISLNYVKQSNELERQKDLILEYNDFLKSLQDENDAAHRKFSKIAKSELLSSLTERERQVLSLINKTYSEISAALFISKETVISHKKNIEAKLNIRGKESLSEFAKACELLV